MLTTTTIIITIIGTIFTSRSASAFISKRFPSSSKLLTWVTVSALQLYSKSKMLVLQWRASKLQELLLELTSQVPRLT